MSLRGERKLVAKNLDLRIKKISKGNIIFNKIYIENANIKLERYGNVYYIYDIGIDLDNNILKIFSGKQELLKYDGSKLEINKGIQNHLPIIPYEVYGYITKDDGHIVIYDSRNRYDIVLSGNKIRASIPSRYIYGKIENNKIIVENFGYFDVNLMPIAFEREISLYKKHIRSLLIKKIEIDLSSIYIDYIANTNISGRLSIANGRKSSTFTYKEIKGNASIEKENLKIRAKGKINASDFIKNNIKFLDDEINILDFSLENSLSNISVKSKFNNLRFNIKNKDIIANGNIDYSGNMQDILSGKINGSISGSIDNAEYNFTSVNSKINGSVKNLILGHSVFYDGNIKHGNIRIPDLYNIKIKHTDRKFYISSDIISGEFLLDENFLLEKCKIIYKDSINIVLDKLNIKISGKLPTTNVSLKSFSIIKRIPFLNDERYYVDIDINDVKGNALLVVDESKRFWIESLKCYGNSISIEKKNNVYEITIGNAKSLHSNMISGKITSTITIGDNISGTIYTENLTLIQSQSNNIIESLITKIMQFISAPTTLIKSLVTNSIVVPNINATFNSNESRIFIDVVSKNLEIEINASGYIDLGNNVISITGYISPLYIINKTLKKIFSPIETTSDTLIRKKFYITGKADEPRIRFF